MKQYIDYERIKRSIFIQLDIKFVHYVELLDAAKFG